MQKAFSAVSLYYTELYLFDITHICTYVRGVLAKMRGKNNGKKIL